jgi:hypothetical protein
MFLKFENEYCKLRFLIIQSFIRDKYIKLLHCFTSVFQPFENTQKLKDS